MPTDYETARARLARVLGDLHLNTDDDGSVTLLYPMTVADYERGAQAVLGVITDGDLVALAAHRCDPRNRVIRTSSDLDELHLMLADFGWFHFAVEDRHRRAWLIVENEHGDLSATCGSDEWHPAERVLRADGPLVLLQDLRPPFGRPAAPVGEPTDKSILEILGVSEEAVEDLQKQHHEMHKVMRYVEQGCRFCVGPIGGAS